MARPPPGDRTCRDVFVPMIDPKSNCVPSALGAAEGLADRKPRHQACQTCGDRGIEDPSLPAHNRNPGDASCQHGSGQGSQREGQIRRRLKPPHRQGAICIRRKLVALSDEILRLLDLVDKPAGGFGPAKRSTCHPEVNRTRVSEDPHPSMRPGLRLYACSQPSAAAYGDLTIEPGLAALNR